MRKVIWMLCCGLALSACGQSEESQPALDTVDTAATTEVLMKNINPAEAEELIQEQQPVVLDVRTAAEYESGHLEGAQNIDVLGADFETSLAQLDKKATYLVYCKSGGRSARAMSIMEEKGFTVVYNMQGGITAWKAQSKPTVQ